MAEVIVALDVSTAAEAIRIVDQLEGLRWAKVGSVLFGAAGPEVVLALRRRGIDVFLDLKWHDIPTTVVGAVQAARYLDIRLATVHALGGDAMIRAAAEVAGETRLAVVSVLTSFTPDVYWATLGRTPGDLTAEVARLARLGVSAGARAVVASPHEVAEVRKAIGLDPWIVVPGIRPDPTAGDDQARTATPVEAVEAGATHLVVGRPITRAKNPGAVYQALCASVP